MELSGWPPVTALLRPNSVSKRWHRFCPSMRWVAWHHHVLSWVVPGRTGWLNSQSLWIERLFSLMFYAAILALLSRAWALYLHIIQWDAHCSVGVASPSCLQASLMEVFRGFGYLGGCCRGYITSWRLFSDWHSVCTLGSISLLLLWQASLPLLGPTSVLTSLLTSYFVYTTCIGYSSDRPNGSSVSCISFGAIVQDISAFLSQPMIASDHCITCCWWKS